MSTHGPAPPDRRGGRLPASSVAAAVGVSRSRPSAGTTRHRSRRRRRPPPPPKPFRDRLPGGLHARADGRARRRPSRRSPTREHRGRVRLERGAVPRRVEARRRAVLRQAGADEPRGLPLPGDLRLPARRRPRGSSCRPSSRRSAATGGRSTCAYARSKNLTPYDVLKIASMVEKEAAVPGERPLDRRRDLQPAARPDAARDRRDAPLRPAHPADAVDHAVGAREHEPVQHAASSTGCRRRRSRTPASPRSRRPRTRRSVDYLYYVRKPDHRHHFFFASGDAFDAYLAAHGYGPHS